MAMKKKKKRIRKPKRLSEHTRFKRSHKKHQEPRVVLDDLSLTKKAAGTFLKVVGMVALLTVLALGYAHYYYVVGAHVEPHP